MNEKMVSKCNKCTREEICNRSDTTDIRKRCIDGGYKNFVPVHAEPKEEMMICPLWKECTHNCPEKSAHTKREHCKQVGRPFSKCPACIPHVPEEVTEEFNPSDEDCNFLFGVLERFLRQSDRMPSIPKMNKSETTIEILKWHTRKVKTQIPDTEQFIAKKMKELEIYMNIQGILYVSPLTENKMCENGRKRDNIKSFLSSALREMAKGVRK